MVPSDVSPAALDKSFSALNLGLHCVEGIDELNPEPSSLIVDARTGYQL